MKKLYVLPLLIIFFINGCSIINNSVSLEKPNKGEKKLGIDPHVTIGKLNNGLTYYIRENKKPENRADFRLVVNAGSVLESEDQQGLAHLVEHMAFNGTVNYKKQELVDYFESIGVAFGPDLNAYTSFDETVYMIEVPTDDKDIIQQAIQILEDWAHGILFEDEDIDGERPVVGEEWRLGQGANQRMFNKIFPIIFHNSQYGKRLPIGKKAVIDTAHYSTIRKFYTDWYRPDLMSVVAVGDFDKSEMEKLIRIHFDRLTIPENPRERTRFPVPDHDETLVAIATDIEAPYTAISINYKFDKKEENTTQDYRRRIKRKLFSGMLRNRLNELTKASEPPFIYGTSYFNDMVLTKDGFELFAVVNDDDITKGIYTLLIEGQRLNRYGFTETELEREKKQVLRTMQKAFDEREKTESRSFVREYVSNFLSGEPIPGIASELEMHKTFLPNISMEEINEFSHLYMKDFNRVVSVRAPKKEGVNIPTEFEILKIFNEVKNIPISPYIDAFSDEPLIAILPDPGNILSENIHSSIGITEWIMDNGVRVLLKPTDFKNDEILLKAFSPGGTSLAGNKDFLSADLATDIISESGIGNFSSIQLEKKLSGKIVNISPYISELFEGLRGSASPQDIETLFQLIFLHVTSARLDSSAYNSFLTRTSGWLENWKSRPESIFQDTLTVTLSQNHIRKRPLTSEILTETDLHAAVNFYRDRFGDAGDFTFIIVGNFNIDAIKPMILQYLGSLPTKYRNESWVNHNIVPPKGNVDKSVFRGIEPKSLTQIIYTGDCKWSRQFRYDFLSMIEILRIKMREVLREDMGGVYGVRIQGNMSHYPKESFSISIGFGCDPERVDELTTAVKEQIQLIMEEGTTEKYLHKVKETQRRRHEVDLENNRYWLNITEFAVKHDLDLDIINSYGDLVNNLTLNTIHKTANQYFSTDNVIQVTLYPEQN